jgi:hypothetical protein
MTDIDINLGELYRANQKIPPVISQMEGVLRDVRLMRWRIPQEIQDRRDIRYRLENLIRDMDFIRNKLEAVNRTAEDVVVQYLETDRKNKKNAEKFD